MATKITSAARVVERIDGPGNDPDMDDASLALARPTMPHEAMLDSDTFIAVAGTILVRDDRADDRASVQAPTAEAAESVREGEGTGRLPPPPPYGSLIATSSVARRGVRRSASASGERSRDRGASPRRAAANETARP